MLINISYVVTSKFIGMSCHLKGYFIYAWFYDISNGHLKNINFLNYADFLIVQWKTPMYPYERMKKRVQNVLIFLWNNFYLID